MISRFPQTLIYECAPWSIPPMRSRETCVGKVRHFSSSESIAATSSWARVQPAVRAKKI